MSSRSVAELGVVVVAVVVAARALACLLANSMPELVALFVMVVVGRLVWFYTR